MLSKLTAFSREHHMICPGDHIICALSGGADSVALLWSLYLLKDSFGIRLSAAHFNHHLRGDESDEDEAFVRRLCHHYDVPLYVGGAQVQSGEKGLEAAAREARYAYFDTLPGKIATAHTADDNAETVLLHLVRGTGLKGLGGIAPVRGKIIRPMLTVTRTDVLALLEEYCVLYRTDSSNETDAFLRNRLRHHVMPLLKEENPRLAENLSAMALSLRQDAQVLDAISAETATRDVPTLRQMPQALRSRCLEAFLKESGVKEPERGHIALVESLVFSENPSAKAHLPGNVTIERRYDTLCRLRNASAPTAVAVACPGVTELPQWGMRLICAEAKETVNTADAFTVTVQGTVMVRPRRSGDQMRLSGGTKSLKKLLIDRKIPASDRPFVPVLADDTGVLGVRGIGVNLDKVGESYCFRFEDVNCGESRL